MTRIPLTMALGMVHSADCFNREYISICRNLIAGGVDAMTINGAGAAERDGAEDLACPGWLSD